MRVVSSQTAGRPSSVSTPRPAATSSTIAWATTSLGPERVGELLPVGVQQHRAVGARGLGDGVALHGLGPGAAVRVVLERVEVARLGAQLERELRDLAGRAGMIRGQLAALLRLAEAAAAGGEDDRARLDLHVAAAREPARLGGLERAKRRLRQHLGGAGLDALTQRLRDREPRAVAHLEQPLARRAAAARQAVAAVLLAELDALLLEPGDRSRGLLREDADEPEVGRLVRRGPDVLRVLLRGVVVADGGLDAALRLGRVRRGERTLRRERDARAGALGRNGRGKAGGAASDDEHVYLEFLGHDGLHRTVRYLICRISNPYFRTAAARPIYGP